MLLRDYQIGSTHKRSNRFARRYRICLAPTALFSHEPGATPQECDRTKNAALQARFNEPRLQRWVLLIYGTWGARTRLAMNAAPLPLSKYAD